MKLRPALPARSLIWLAAHFLGAYVAAAAPAAKPSACEVLPDPPAGQVCAVTAGGGALLLKGVVLADERAFEGGAVLVDATGLIRYVGCAAGLPASLAGIAAGATRIECKEGVI